MAIYKTPGVYVEETSNAPLSVAEVATAIPAFIGFTQIVPKTGPKVPVRITSMLEYEGLFGKAKPYAYDVKIVRDTNTAKPSITSIGKDAAAEKTIIYYALQLYFTNDGGPCYIVPLSDGDTHEEGLEAVASVDEVTLLVCPDAATIHASSPQGGASNPYYAICQKALQQCADSKDRFAILDVLDTDLEAAEFRNEIGNENLKCGAAYLPYLKTNLSYGYDEPQVEVTIDQTKTQTLAELSKDQPKIYRFVKTALNNAPKVVLPPSAAIAGVYARVDQNRGVWKAPANVSVIGIEGPTRKITDREQASLNIDATAGKSINTIRAFTGKGTLVWGARTLAGNDNEWRYVPVRRLFITVEESIQKSTSFAVFEPNDHPTWKKVENMVDSYLYGLWQQGALAGSTPKQAYFIKVGLNQTMTAQDILDGRMIIEIGMAVVRPAEFMILRIVHNNGGAIES
ncbi:phage tail sheath family protein [Lewinella cohaerens]|uniref:phage tail sheath family protein n=1 Tax=Lewinella cohaerens TaxID=70995 RepID=UPI00037C3E4E|nr:phage tail sheath C-terminal domain-containing protein [Lewinella cohaerens]